MPDKKQDWAKEKIKTMYAEGHEYVKSRNIAPESEYTPSEIGRAFKMLWEKGYLEKWSESGNAITWRIVEPGVECEHCGDVHYEMDRKVVEHGVSMCPRCGGTRVIQQ
jgi:Zn finger protein HypA/HybF involved in hydrogenase expression